MQTMSADTVRQELRQFIIDSFLFGRDQPFSDEDSLIENGLIDSTGVLELIGFLEEKYDLRIEQVEMVPDNLDSIRRLSDFIHKKHGESA